MENKKLEQIIKLKKERNTLVNELSVKSNKAVGMSMYSIDGQFFDTESEIGTYCFSIDKSIDEAIKLDYMREFEGKTDVIRATKSDGTVNLYAALDEDGYYSYTACVKNGIPCYSWKYEFGSLKDVYAVFRNKGIVFENDVYAKVARKYQRIAAMAR